MATNSRVKMGVVLAFQNGLEYRHSDFKNKSAMICV